MDLWDLTKLLLRRWYVAAPMLLLSVVMVFLVAQTVGPDYSAKGHVQMIPAPSVGKAVDPNAKPRPTNPWLDLGYEALANAAALAVSDQAVLEGLAGRGFTDSVTVTMDENAVLLEIEAVGTSRAQATATVREVIKLIEQDIAAKQKQYGVLKEDTITSLTLNDGSSPEVVRSKVMRVLVVAAGTGVLLTIAATIAIDALLRRRTRRLVEQVAEVPAQRRAPSAPAAVAAPAPPTNGHSKAAVVEPIPIRTASNVDDQATGVLPPATVVKAGDGTVKAVEYKSANGPKATTERAAAKEPVDDVRDFPPVGSDATIVLPLSHVSWRTGKKT